MCLSAYKWSVPDTGRNFKALIGRSALAFINHWHHCLCHYCLLLRKAKQSIIMQPTDPGAQFNSFLECSQSNPKKLAEYSRNLLNCAPAPHSARLAVLVFVHQIEAVDHRLRYRILLRRRQIYMQVIL